PDDEPRALVAQAAPPRRGPDREPRRRERRARGRAARRLPRQHPRRPRARAQRARGRGLNPGPGARGGGGSEQERPERAADEDRGQRGEQDPAQLRRAEEGRQRALQQRVRDHRDYDRAPGTARLALLSLASRAIESAIASTSVSPASAPAR